MNWLRIKCFITGYDFIIIKDCSEASRKTLKRTVSALAILCLIWAYIGYNFIHRYMNGSLLASILGALILAFIALQIERQIILTVEKDWKTIISRLLIGFTMAFIGSIIIDQILFKDDIERKQIERRDQKVREIYPIKSSELGRFISEKHSEIIEKEKILQTLLNEKQLIIQNFNNKTTLLLPKIQYDSLGNVISKTLETVVNPSYTLTEQKDRDINLTLSSLNSLKEIKNNYEKEKLDMRNRIETELSNKIGFLDEIEALYEIVSHSFLTFFVWLIFFIFFLSIESIILISKLTDKKNDYEETVLHQQQIRSRALGNLSRIS